MLHRYHIRFKTKGKLMCILFPVNKTMNIIRARIFIFYGFEVNARWVSERVIPDEMFTIGVLYKAFFCVIVYVMSWPHPPPSSFCVKVFEMGTKSVFKSSNRNAPVLRVFRFNVDIVSRELNIFSLPFREFDAEVKICKKVSYLLTFIFRDINYDYYYYYYFRYLLLWILIPS